eukprot:GILK01001805.1.p2 GENE.GILK01001805.1~~GILK01001805.1.p2  ORF type:complete len:132 (+),score=8.39 GILK01001805.1:388-783(+)
MLIPVSSTRVGVSVTRVSLLRCLADNSCMHRGLSTMRRIHRPLLNGPTPMHKATRRLGACVMSVCVRVCVCVYVYLCVYVCVGVYVYVCVLVVLPRLSAPVLFVPFCFLLAVFHLFSNLVCSDSALRQGCW